MGWMSSFSFFISSLSCLTSLWHEMGYSGPMREYYVITILRPHTTLAFRFRGVCSESVLQHKADSFHRTAASTLRWGSDTNNISVNEMWCFFIWWCPFWAQKFTGKFAFIILAVEFCLAWHISAFITSYSLCSYCSMDLKQTGIFPAPIKLSVTCWLLPSVFKKHSIEEST